MKRCSNAKLEDKLAEKIKVAMSHPVILRTK